MTNHPSHVAPRLVLAAVGGWLLTLPGLGPAQSPEPIVYTLRVPAPETHRLEVEVRIPTARRDTVDLMMPIWSPGFYRVEDYAGKVQDVSARGPDGRELAVIRRPPQTNHWIVPTGSAASVTVTYHLLAEQRSVTTNWVGPNSLSGINADSSTVSYYVKGAVLGFLLDARVRHATGGTRSLDEVMRLAYQRYAGTPGFTPEQFTAVASEVAGTDLTVWFRRAAVSTEELDYREALDWFGLRFTDAGASEPARWTLAVPADASNAERTHLRDLVRAR